MRTYQETIREIAAGIGLVGVDAAGVEASMRLQFGTLDHLSRSEFRDEVEIAVACERSEPGYLAGLAESMGVRRES